MSEVIYLTRNTEASTVYHTLYTAKKKCITASAQ